MQITKSQTTDLPRELLASELERRQRSNRRYSLRSFARDLKLPPGRLSELLSGKRQFTKKNLEIVIDGLPFDSRIRRSLVSIFNNENATQKNRLPSYTQVSLDQFAVIADWYHFAILSLIELPCFRPDPAWISKQLGISTIQARSALSRLARLGLVVQDGSRLISSGKNIETPTDIASRALRKSHRQSLIQAIESLDKDAIDERDVTSITMAIDSSLLPEAKKKIARFRKELCAFLESGTPDRVYNLNIQMVPLSQQEKK